jgi:hypothetical protein
MNKIFLSAGLCLVFLLGVFHVSAHSGNDNDLKAYYENCIDNRIKCCNCKALRWDSKSKKISCCAMIAMLKAAYFRENKNLLIEEMNAKNIGKKQYKVDHYLNEKFFKVYRSSALKGYMTVSASMR